MAPSPYGYLSTRTCALLLGTMLVMSLVLAPGSTQVGSLATWWTSVGLGVGLLALSAPRRWAVLIALTLGASYLGAALHGELRMGTTSVVAISHAAQALLAALVVTRGARRISQLTSPGDLGRLVAGGILAGLVAVASELGVAGGGGRGMPTLAIDLFVAHWSSVVLLGALVLVLGPGLPRPFRVGELAVQSFLLVAVSAAIFVPIDGRPYIIAPIPLLAWAALRFDIRVVVVEVLTFSAGVTVATSLGRGPFAVLSQSRIAEARVDTITLTYLLAVALMILLLALIVAQRQGLLAQVSGDERRFRRNFTESPVGMVFLHAHAGELVVDEVNAAACAMLRTEESQAVGARLQDLVAPLDSMKGELTRLVRGETDAWHGLAAVVGRPQSRLETTICAVDTSVTPHLYSAQLLDVTQEHDAHRRLESALKLTDATLDTTACVILVTDSTGTIVRVNAATKEITGHDESDLLGLPLWESALPVLTRAETEAMFLWPNRSGYAMVREHVVRTANGQPVRLVWNNNVVHDELGLPSHSVLTGIDVTAERSSSGLVEHLLQASIATALLGIDVMGRITVCNAGAAQMLGVPAHDMLGRSFTEVFDPTELLVRTGAAEPHEAFLCLVGMIGDRDESSARDWTWRTADGSQVIVSMTLSATDDQVEERVGFLCVGRDVTEQHETQQSLVAALAKERTAVERLRQLDHAKDEFVTTVSHELRTPITNIMGYSEMLRDGSVVEPLPEQATMLNTISRNGRRLIDICNDLLVLGSLDQPSTPTTHAPVDLRDSALLAEETARALVVNRDVSLHFEIDPEPLEVLGDRALLDQILINLVSNAIKFTDDGGNIHIRATRATDGIVLSVIDTGMGIAPADHEAVFDRFYRTAEANKLAIAGTGLGLPIVAGIVAAHGGTIALDSALGEGTTFTVVLPAR